MFSKFNEAIDSVKNGLDAQIALATADQKESLANAKLALADLKDLVADLKNENRTLRDRLDKKEALVLDDSVYWLKDDQVKEQPFCPACYSNNDKIVPMKPDTQQTRDTEFQCPVCKHRANPYNYQYEPEVGVVGGSLFNLGDRY